MNLLDQAIGSHPIGLIVVVGIVALLAAVAVAWAIDAGIGWALGEDRPHHFNPDHPSHCDACWREAHRRRARALEAQPRHVPVAEFRASSSNQWPRV